VTAPVTSFGSGRIPADADRGVAFVELALALPVLAIFVLGLFSSGAALNSDVRLNAAVHDGTRYAARLDPNVYSVYGEGSWAANVSSVALERDTSLTSTDVCVAAVVGQADGSVAVYQATTGPGAEVGANYSSTGAPCWQPADASTVEPDRVYVQVAAQRDVQLDYYFGRQTVTLESRLMAPAEWDAR
jgi:Flp pilus assembly protein TadG